LFQAVGELQAVAVQDEGLFLGSFGVQRSDEAGFPEKELKVFDLIKVAAECVVGVNGEISGDDGESGAGLNPGFEKISDDTTSVIIPYA